MTNNLISVSSKLMQNYHVGKPISSGTQIATFSNREGDIEILSIGSDSKLYNFYPNSSELGWGMTEIKLPDNYRALEVVSGFTGGTASALVKVNAVVKGEGLLAVPLIVLTRIGTHEVPFDVKFIMKGGEHYGVKNTQLPVDPNSISLLSRQLPEGDQFAYKGISTDDGWALIHEVYPFDISDYAGANYMSRSFHQNHGVALLDYTNPGTNKKIRGNLAAAGFDQPTYNNFNRVKFMAISHNSSRNFLEGRDNTCCQISTTEIPNVAFAIRSSDKALLYLTSYQPTYNRPANCTVLSEIMGEDGTIVKQKMAKVYGTTDRQRRPMAFCIGEDGFVYHVELNDDNTTWSILTAIESHHQFTSLSVSKNDHTGDPVVFAVTNADQIFKISLDPDPQLDLWQCEEVEIEPIKKEDRKAEEINTYSTELTVFDTKGVIRPNAKVKIWTNGSQHLIINGKGYIVNGTQPAEVVSNDAGKVTIVSLTDDIATSILHVWTEFMDDDKGVAIQANGYIQDKFSKITTDELLQAKGKEGQPLLKDDYREQAAVESMAEALKSSMAIIEQSAKADERLHHSNYSRVVSGAKCHHVMSDSFGQRHRINLDQTYTNNWQLSFESGLPVYTQLNHNQAAALIYNNEIQTLDMAMYGFFDFLSDVWRMVKEGVADLVNIVVSGIETAVTVLIDGVKKIWRGVVNFVDEIFQAVLGFFESVKVYFEDLFHWLGTIFNWKNILNTKKVINHSFNVMLDFVSDSVIQLAKQKMDEKIIKLENGIHDTIQKYINKIGEDTGLIEIEEQNNDDNHKAMVGTVENNVMTNAVCNNYHVIDKLHVNSVQKINDAFDTIKPLVKKLDSSEAWDKAMQYFNSMKDHPDKVLELTMLGLLELVEAVTTWVLNKVMDIMDAIFDALSELIHVIKDVLNTQVYIPLVTEIYNLAHKKDGKTGLPFTYMDIPTIIIAAPTTIIYTLACGKAPFPDDASVESFKNFFTVDWLNQKMGITPHNKAVTSFSAEDMQVVNNVFNCMSGCIYTVTAIIKPLVDIVTITSEGAPSTKLKVLSGIEATLSSLGWIASIPWLVEAKEEFGTQGFEVQTTMWFVEFFDDIVLDWIFFVKEPEGEIESMATTIFSSINLIEYIILANIDPKRAFNVSKTLPGVFAIVRPIAIVTPPYGPTIGKVVMGIIDVVSNGVMAGYSFAAMKPDTERLS